MMDISPARTLMSIGRSFDARLSQELTDRCQPRGALPASRTDRRCSKLANLNRSILVAVSGLTDEDGAARVEFNCDNDNQEHGRQQCEPCNSRDQFKKSYDKLAKVHRGGAVHGSSDTVLTDRFLLRPHHSTPPFPWLRCQPKMWPNPARRSGSSATVNSRDGARPKTTPGSALSPRHDRAKCSSRAGPGVLLPANRRDQWRVL